MRIEVGGRQRFGGAGGMALDRTTDLSPRQRETLHWVRNFIRQHHLPPTVREIGDAFGIKSSSVFDLLQALERKGSIKRERRKARSIVILDCQAEHSLPATGERHGPRRT